MVTESYSIIIVSAGSGTRMGSRVPKQYLPVNGKPVIVWTIEKFIAFDPHIKMVVVLGNEHERHWQEIYDQFLKSKNYFKRYEPQLVEGGKTRSDSVRNGLNRIDETGVVGIHDAVRPMVSLETIKRCFTAAAEYGSAIPVINVEDSIREGNADQSRQLDRAKLRRVQTPQVFKTAKIKEAYADAAGQEFTDDAAVYEKRFGKVLLVQGNKENIKITGPADLKIASLFLE